MSAPHPEAMSRYKFNHGFPVIKLGNFPIINEVDLKSKSEEKTGSHFSQEDNSRIWTVSQDRKAPLIIKDLIPIEF